MLDITFIRNNPESTKEGVTKKSVEPKLVDKLLQRDEMWREKIRILDALKAEQNELAKKLASTRTEEALSRAQLLKQQILKIAEEEKVFKKRRDETLSLLPNLPFDDVPVGDDESGNKELRQVGEKPSFRFSPKDYLSLAENLGIINVKRAAQVAGTRFGYLLGDGVRLEFALVQLAFDFLSKKGFIPVLPPVMVRPKVMEKMGKGRFIKDKDAFYIEEDNLYLIGSSEHTIGPLHIDDVLKEEELPRRYVGFSTCFRREAGSYGKDTRGILRVHQFDKIEMFSFTHPDKSEEEHQELLAVQEELMQQLELPYRVVEVCAGGMGWTDARQYDIETWFPSEEQYRETHSASNTTDFQARGINAKYKPKRGDKPQYLHMLNATAFSQRPILAIIENYQTKKGSVRVPKVLQKYLGKKEIT